MVFTATFNAVLISELACLVVVAYFGENFEKVGKVGKGKQNGELPHLLVLDWIHSTRQGKPHKHHVGGNTEVNDACQ